jgi:hypothetical protein
MTINEILSSQTDTSSATTENFVLPLTCWDICLVWWQCLSEWAKNHSIAARELNVLSPK